MGRPVTNAVCDFCLSSNPTAVYPCRDFLMSSSVGMPAGGTEPNRKVEFFAHPGTAPEVEEFARKMAEQCSGRVLDHWSGGAWAACAVCASYIEEEDYDGLLKHMGETGWQNLVLTMGGEGAIARMGYTRDIAKQLNESNVRQFAANRIEDENAPLEVSVPNEPTVLDPAIVDAVHLCAQQIAEMRAKHDADDEMHLVVVGAGGIGGVEVKASNSALALQDLIVADYLPVGCIVYRGLESWSSVFASALTLGENACREVRSYINGFVAQRFPSRQTFTVRQEIKIGRNDRCPCGSNRKFKKCHGGSF